MDIGALVQGATAQATKQMAIDDGSGTVKVWRVEDFKMVDWPENLYGQFYAGDSYIVKYTYKKSGWCHHRHRRCEKRTPDFVVDKEFVLLYFWQGRDSSQDEKGASALLASTLDEQMGGSPTQVCNSRIT